MVLLFIDGFETGNALKWDEFSGPGPTCVSGEGRFGSYGCRGGGGSTGAIKWVNNLQTIISGNGLKMSSGGILWAWYDGATIQVHGDSISSTQIAFYRGAGTSNLLGTYTHPLGILYDSIFRQWQTKLKIDPSVGTLELKMNGVSVLTLTGLNTRATANSYATRVAFFWQDNSAIVIDDVYLADTSGALNNDFLGDVRALPIIPNAVGATTNWVRGGTTHSNNWESVDEIPANGDTDYVASSTAGDIDTYGMTDLSISSGSVLGVQWEGYLRKDDAGSRTACPVIHSGGADHLGANFLPLDSYKYFWEMFNTDPQDGAAWDISRVNAVQLGQKLVT